MQTILGSGGAIGIELAKALKQHTGNIRLVSRNPQAVNSGDHLFSADLTNPADVLKAVEGSKIVYLTVGLPYNTKVWQTTWPVLMENVIGACKTHHARLVFFDNIYMYDPAFLASMTEETPIRPVSKKGVVRSQIAEMMYQYDRDYVFDSTKFEKRFAFKPTPYLEGIKNIIKQDYASRPSGIKAKAD